MKEISKETLVSCDLMALEIAINKIDTVLNDLRNEYFIDTFLGEYLENPTLKSMYRAAELRSSILCDYVVEAQETIESIKKNL